MSHALDEGRDLRRGKARADQALHVPQSGDFRLLATRWPATTAGTRGAIWGLQVHFDIPVSYRHSHAGRLAGVRVRLERCCDPSGIRNGEGTLGSPDTDCAHPRPATFVSA